MRISPVYSMGAALALACLGSGCATGIYDSVWDGLNKIAEVHLKSDKPIQMYHGPWRSREPGNTYGHEAPPKSVQTVSRASGQRPSSTSVAPPSAEYVPTRQDSAQVENEVKVQVAPLPNPLSVNTQSADTGADTLEREIWQHYKQFEFPEVFITGTKLAYMPAANPSQRAMAFILMGSVACIQGRVQEASDHFRRAIQTDPARSPDPTVFPSGVCRLYREVADGCTQDP